MASGFAAEGSGFSANVKIRGGDGVRRRHALLIGIDAYDDPSLRLEYCVADVGRLGRVLANGGFEVAALHDGLAVDRIPTRDNVRRALSALVAAADEDDVLVVHFSGHGMLVDGRPHLLLSDTPPGVDAVRARGLPLAEVLATLRSAPRWVAVFLDACHMGLGLDPDAAASTRHGNACGGGFALLAGSTEGQITQDSTERGAGIFTDALVRGLSGGAASPDGSVSFGALAQFVQRAVRDWRRSAEGRAKLAAQTPVLRLEVSDLSIFPPRGYVALDPGHTGSLEYTDASHKIRAAAFSPNGRWLATVSEDRTARFWNPATGKQVLKTMRHDGHVGGLAFSPDSILLATACNDGRVRLWQAPGTSPLLPLMEPLPARVNAVAWAPRGPCLAAATDLGAHLYQASDRSSEPVAGVRDFEGHDGTVWCVAFTPDGALVTGGADGTVRLWNTESGACRRVFRHEGPVWAVAVSPDGRMIASGGTDAPAGPVLRNVPRLWDRKTGKEIVRLLGHAQGVTALAFSPDGAHLASSSYDGSARLWTADGRPLSSFSVESAPEAYGVTFSPDGGSLFVGFSDGRGRIYDVSGQVERASSAGV